MKLSTLIGTWTSSKGNTWIVRKALDRSNRFLDIEFRIITKYLEPFGFSSDAFEKERWNRFDSDLFKDEIERYRLVKNE